MSGKTKKSSLIIAGTALIGTLFVLWFILTSESMPPPPSKFVEECHNGVIYWHGRYFPAMAPKYSPGNAAPDTC